MIRFSESEIAEQILTFSKLETTEEKLISLWLSVVGSKRQVQLVNELSISDRHCRRIIERLSAKKIIISSKDNEFGITLWSTGQEVRSTGQEVRSTGQEVRSHSHAPLKLTLSNNLTNSNKGDSRKEEETASGSTASAVKPRRKTATAPQQKGITAAKPQKAAKTAAAAPVAAAAPAGIIADSPSAVISAVHIGNPPIITEMPAEMPERGDFDGLIYAKNLPRERYLHRMVAALGIGEPVKAAIGSLSYEDERFLLFKDTLSPELFSEICMYREIGSKWSVNYPLKDKFRDEVLHRLAFARAMSVSELEDINRWIYEQRGMTTKKTPRQISKEFKGADMQTIIIQRLRRIFWNRGWGFTYNHFLPKESFYYASESFDNAEELCPVYSYLKRQSSEEYAYYQKERQIAARPETRPAERSPLGGIQTATAGLQTAEQQAFLRTLETLLGAEKYGLWFGESKAGISGDAVVLTLRNKFSADWIVREYLPAVLETADKVFGRERAVVIAAADGKYKKTLRIPAGEQTTTPAPPQRGITAATAPDPSKEGNKTGKYVNKPHFSPILSKNPISERKPPLTPPQRGITAPPESLPAEIKTPSENKAAEKKPGVIESAQVESAKVESSKFESSQIELTSAEKREVIEKLIDKTPENIERSLKLALLQKKNRLKHQAEKPPLTSHTETRGTRRVVEAETAPAHPKEGNNKQPVKKPEQKTAVKPAKKKEQPDAFKKLRKAFKEAA